MTLTTQLLVDSFEWRRGRPADESWLPQGALHIIDTLFTFGDVNEPTQWAVALLLSVIENGGTCLPLEDINSLRESHRLPEALRGASPDEWASFLTGASFGDGDSIVRPLVLREGCLYFDRLWRLEQSVAKHLLTPIGERARQDPPTWHDVVRDLFGPPSADNQQQVVASQLFSHRTQILAGGPGTGKTFTVAKLILAAHRATDGAATVRLCAPTGKAAQRIKESLLAVLAEIAPHEVEAFRDTVQPTTIHRLLGINPVLQRRRSKEPIHADLVIVDEVSMVDVVVLEELLSALDENSRLLLVGDPQQLQSVDVGSVMADIVAAASPALPVTTLKTVHRVSHDSRNERSQLLAFFDAVREARVDEALEQLRSGGTSLRFVEIPESGESGVDEAAILSPVQTRARDLVIAARNSDDAAWRVAMTSTMVLTAQHNGPFGRLWWVDRVASELGVSVLGAPISLGTPVLITSTDHANGLINGDVGLIVANADGTTRLQLLTADLADDDDAVVTKLRPSVVTHWQPWWAMTIHKSQGSEFDNVVVAITPGTRLLSRELLYTAVTRAKRSVTIIGTASDVENALRTPARRLTGLRTALLSRAARNDDGSQATTG